MAEYITKERAKDLIVAASSGNSTRLARMLSKLEDEHPADVVEVVHATTSNEYWNEVYCLWKTCSNCKCTNHIYANYCNWCGARLDGDEE